MTFDLAYSPGDPDVAPGVNSPSTSGSVQGDSADVVLDEPEVSPGVWLLNPAEIGPFPASGAPTVHASASLSAVTQSFDPSITSSTGDMWSALNGLSSGFSPTYLEPGQSTTIAVSVTPTGSPGTTVSGTLYVDDYSLASDFDFDLPNADELAAIPYSYTVAPKPDPATTRRVLPTTECRVAIWPAGLPQRKALSDLSGPLLDLQSVRVVQGETDPVESEREARRVRHTAIVS